VGVFAARISRGRTIREFILGMLIVPTLICAAWFAIAGGAAIDLDQSLGGTIAAAVNPDLGGDPAAGFFQFLQYYPLPIFISLVSIFMLWIFFVAGADAGTIVLGQMSAGGVRDVSRFVRLAWGVVIGAMAFVLLAAGGLDALRQAALLAGVPFAIIVIFMCYALYKGLRADYREQERQEEPQGEVTAEQPASNSSPSPSK
jgi:glycine betaine transporter